MSAWSPAELEAVALVFGGLGHRLRVRIVLAFDDAPLSPRELAQRLEVELSVVAFHVRRLRDDGLLELVAMRRARGGLQSLYRLSERGRRARGYARRELCDATTPQ